MKSCKTTKANTTTSKTSTVAGMRVLSPADLHQVAGGLNPQPLPPRYMRL